MDTKKEVIQRLRQLDAMEQAVRNLPGEIRRLHALGQSTGELKKSLKHAEATVALVRDALQVLTPEERLVVDRLFIFPARGNVQQLCWELGVEQSSVYRRREKALAHLAIAMFGKGWG